MAPRTRSIVAIVAGYLAIVVPSLALMEGVLGGVRLDSSGGGILLLAAAALFTAAVAGGFTTWMLADRARARHTLALIGLGLVEAAWLTFSSRNDAGLGMHAAATLPLLLGIPTGALTAARRCARRPAPRQDPSTDSRLVEADTLPIQECAPEPSHRRRFPRTRAALSGLLVRLDRTKCWLVHRGRRLTIGSAT